MYSFRQNGERMERDNLGLPEPHTNPQLLSLVLPDLTFFLFFLLLIKLKVLPWINRRTSLVASPSNIMASLGQNVKKSEQYLNNG